MKTTHIRYVILLISPFLLTGCFTSSFLQTAKPLDKGAVEVTGGLTGYATEDDRLPGLNSMVRVGVGANSDIGIGYATGIFGHARLDYKYNFYRSADDRRFLSTGLGLDFFSDDEDATGVPALNIPLYFSINHQGNVIPYFGQRFTLGLSHMDVLFGKGSGSHDIYYTGVAGIRFGKLRLKGYVEFSYSVGMERYRHSFYNYQTESLQSFDNRYETTGVELNVGLTIPFGGKKKE